MVILKVLLVNKDLSVMLRKVHVLVQHWRGHYNQIRPHRTLG